MLIIRHVRAKHRMTLGVYSREVQQCSDLSEEEGAKAYDDQGEVKKEKPAGN